VQALLNRPPVPDNLGCLFRSALQRLVCNRAGIALKRRSSPAWLQRLQRPEVAKDGHLPRFKDAEAILTPMKQSALDKHGHVLFPSFAT